MTPEEAKTKWCPAVRFTGAGTGSPEHGGNYDWATNRGDDYGERAFCCVADECMAWRWKEGYARGPIEEIGPNLPRDLPERPGHIWRAGKDADERLIYGLFAKTGYCGLAGKPS